MKLLSGLSVVALCATGVACSTAPSVENQRGLHALYERAIFDAAIFDPAHQVPLRMILSKTGDATLVTWVPESQERFYPIGAITVDRETWVTVDGDVRERCHGLGMSDEHALTTRLQQLLGLPPLSEKRVFVTLQAPVAALFRPCLNRDIVAPSCDRAQFSANTPDEHKAWIASQMVASYQIHTAGDNPSGHPWTGLGYAYDWAPRSDHIGPSEYVIRPGTSARVIAREGSMTYCQN